MADGTDLGGGVAQSAPSAPAPSAAPAPAGGANAPAPAAAAPDPALEAARAFSWDPFEVPAADAAEADVGAQPPAAGGADQGAPAPAPTQQATQGRTPEDYLARIAAAVEQPRTVVAPAAAPGGQAQATDPFAWVPQYNVAIPEQVLAAMESEDPGVRRQGITALVNMQSRMLHARIVSSFRDEFARVIPHVFRHYMQEMQGTQQVTGDFYGKYPMLDREELRPLVVRAAQIVMQETGASQWSEQLRDAVAQRVLQAVAGVTGGASAPAAPARPAPPVLTPTAGRPAPTGANEIMELLF